MSRTSPPDRPHLDVQKVGVKGIEYPITLLDKARGTQSTVARADISVRLSHPLDTARESRMVEILNKHRLEVSITNLPGLLRELVETFDAESAHVDFSFPYFFNEKSAGQRGGRRDGVRLPHLRRREARRSIWVSKCGCQSRFCIPIPKTTGVPARATSGRWSPAAVRFRKIVWIEELIGLIEKAASSPLYSLLKRSDERHVTLQAYENPRSQEDVVRAVAEQLARDENILWFAVQSESLESLHNHNNYALIEWARPAGTP
ncbi:MAG: GTP cyclohydrolase, FolE2/MptA family [Deltaproteobacteria bacterium]|nr:GTP cyclohydrolase, FolE2/MptA family [Deltaproteobacteria bacterium]